MTVDLTKDLFDSYGRPIIVISNMDDYTNIETAQALTVASGVIAPTAPEGLFANLAVSGEGAAADTLTQITADSTWEGKILILRNATATPATNTLTINNVAGLIMLAGATFTLNHADDEIWFKWKSANVWKEILRANYG
jgi:hypothetical protein